MQLTTKDAVIDITKKEIKFSLDVVASMDELEGYRSSEKVADLVSHAIAQKVLDLRMNEILAKVDLETIVRKVQMNVIQSLGSPR